jgi:hypothetical protein
MALAGLTVLGAGDSTHGDDASIATSRTHAQSSIEAIVARAAVASLVGGDLALLNSVRAVDEALTAAPADAGWLIPIEPLLGVHRQPDVWTPVLARLRARAA